MATTPKPMHRHAIKYLQWRVSNSHFVFVAYVDNPDEMERPDVYLYEKKELEEEEEEEESEEESEEMEEAPPEEKPPKGFFGDLADVMRE